LEQISFAALKEVFIIAAVTRAGLSPVCSVALKPAGGLGAPQVFLRSLKSSSLGDDY